MYRYCSPTRSSLNTGRLPIHVNEMNYNNDNPGGADHPLCPSVLPLRPLPSPGPRVSRVPAGGVDPRMTTLAQRLQRASYYTAALGKWYARRHRKARAARG